MLLKILTKTDIAIIFIILFSSGISFLYPQFRKKDNNILILNFNNQIYTVESLTESKTIELDTVAVIEINDGKARIAYSTCKNQNCVSHGWSNSESIICVPNKIHLDFSNNNDEEKVFITH